MKRLGLFGVICLVILMVTSSVFAVPQKREPEVLANQLLDQLENAYNKEDLTLFVSLYYDPVVMVDVTRDLQELFSRTRITGEIAGAFAALTGIQASITERIINFDGDTIIVRCNRSVTGNEIPVISKVGLLIVMKRPNYGACGRLAITDQILLTEEYIPKSTVDGEVSANYQSSQRNVPYGISKFFF